MKIEKLSSSASVEFTAPVTKNFANAHPVVDDHLSRELRQSRELQELLHSKNDSILEIRKVWEYQYEIITNSGHIIPIEIHGVPYRYGHGFMSLNWDGGVYKVFHG